MDQKNFDIIIIGAGVIGYSIAFRLKRREPSLKVAVLGDPMNSLIASRAAAGMLAPFCECERGDRFFQFCRESLDHYPRFIEELVSVSGAPVFFSMAGSIMPESSLRDDWDERLQFFREEKIPHEVWPVAKVREKLPHFSESCGQVIWVGEGQVNNRQLHDSLFAALNELGVEVYPQSVTGFQRDETQIFSALTESGEIKGKKFVLAAGSWSKKLGEDLQVFIPMKPVKGQMCRLLMDESLMEYTVHGILTYIAPWQEGNGYVIGSTMEDRGFNPLVEEDVIQKLIDNASKILPCLKNAELAESWTGLRPAADDLMPVMGKSSLYKNLFFSTGHFRNGILQTPLQADYMADSILGEVKESIEEFSPFRYRI